MKDFELIDAETHDSEVEAWATAPQLPCAFGEARSASDPNHWSSSLPGCSRATNDLTRFFPGNACDTQPQTWVQSAFREYTDNSSTRRFSCTLKPGPGCSGPDRPIDDCTNFAQNVLEASGRHQTRRQSGRCSLRQRRYLGDCCAPLGRPGLADLRRTGRGLRIPALGRRRRDLDVDREARCAEFSRAPVRDSPHSPRCAGNAEHYAVKGRSRPAASRCKSTIRLFPFSRSQNGSRPHSRVLTERSRAPCKPLQSSAARSHTPPPEDRTSSRARNH